VPLDNLQKGTIAELLGEREGDDNEDVGDFGRAPALTRAHRPASKQHNGIE
jgi:hypothetical protein